MVTRQSRDERRRRRARVQLRTRDIDVLRALARFRIARTKDLVSLVFPGVRADTAAARLRRLFDAGYVDVQAGDRSAESVYSLGHAGRAALDQRGVAHGRRPSQNLEHHLAIVRTWVQLVVTVRAIPQLRLELIRSDWEIRAEVGDDTFLIPDLLVQLAVEGKDSTPVRLAVEVDRGTERNPALLAKLERYQAALGDSGGLFGWNAFGLAMVLSGAGVRRRVALDRLITEAWNGWWLLWSEADGPGSSLAALVAALQGETQRSPFDSPYGKGNVVGVTAETSERSLREGSGLSR